MVNVTEGCVWIHGSDITNLRPARGIYAGDLQPLLVVMDDCLDATVTAIIVDPSLNAAVCSAVAVDTSSQLSAQYIACPLLVSKLSSPILTTQTVSGVYYFAEGDTVVIHPPGQLSHTAGYLLLEGSLIVQVDETIFDGNQSTLIHSLSNGLQQGPAVTVDNSLNLRLCGVNGIFNSSDVSIVTFQRCLTLSGITDLQYSGTVDLIVGRWLAPDESLLLSSETFFQVATTVMLEGDMEMRITHNTPVGQQSFIEAAKVQGTFAAFAFTSESIRICNSSLVYSATQVSVLHTPCPPIEVPPDSSDDPQEIQLTGNRYLPANETLNMATNQHVIVSGGCVTVEGQLVLKIKANSQVNSTVTLITSQDGCLEGQFSQIQLDNSANPSVCIGNSSYSPNAFQIALEPCPSDGVISPTPPAFPVGAIVGIVVGSVVLVALVAGLIGWYLVFYRRKAQAKEVKQQLKAAI